MKTQLTKSIKQAAAALLALALAANSSVKAANGTWSNAPTDATWINTLNWLGAVPGTINNTANNGVDSASIAFFTNAITTYGGLANPIVPDDATIANGKARMLGKVVFDGPECGAYVFYSPSAYAAQTGTTPETGVLSLCVGTGGGNVTGMYMTTTVTNPQTFLVPVQVRLPSSTTGVYGFTNNATSADATLYFERLFLYPGATGRGVTYVLAGSNTGTNTIKLLAQSANQTGSPTGVRKIGTGRWILSGANTFATAAPFSIEAGTLQVKDAAAFGAGASTGIVLTNATLQIDNVTLNANSVALRHNGIVKLDGTATLNGVNVGAQPSTVATVSTTGSGDVLTLGNAINKVTGGAADSILAVSGPGTVYLGNDNNYIGKWSVNAGVLQIASAGALAAGSSVSIAAGGKLDVSPLGATTWNLTTAGISASGTGTTVGTTAATITADAGATVDLATGAKAISLTFTPTAFTGDATHPALYVSQGTLQLGGNTFTVNNAGGTALGAGTYRLIEQASGSVTDGGSYAVTVTGSGLVPSAVASIQVSGGNVNLVVSVYVAKDLVWTGGPANFDWDNGINANWLDGVTPSVFNLSDRVVFNAVGSTNPTVNLVGALSPGSVSVDTTANNYTFSGSGNIAGTASLKKIGTGTLVLSTVNTYSGGTVISNGVLQVGTANAISSTGAGDVVVHSPSVLDVNSQPNTINALIGNGTVDSTSGGAATLTIGNNNNSGTFSGVIQNTLGTLAITKAGNGTETLTASNSYTGATTINGGTLVAANQNALGNLSDVTINAGILDLASTIDINSLAGSGGSVANISGTGTNTIYVKGATTTTYSGSIINGAGGTVALRVMGGSLRLNAGNSYTGGTWVGENTTFLIGNGTGAGVTGALVASNNATLGLPGGSNPPGTPASIATTDGATVTFTSGALGNIWGGQFIGGATSTNRFTQNVSAGGTLSFNGFLGVVQLDFPTSGLRFFNGGGVSGSDNTRFEFINGSAFSRDGQTTVLGEISGGSATSGIGGNSTTNTTSTWIIGGLNTDSTFHGYISSSVPFNTINNLVKSGSGRLTLDGVNITTNTDSATFTNYLYTPLITYAGSTTVSNGVLAIVAPNNYNANTNSSVFNLRSSSAVLDVSQSGYLVDQISVDDLITPTNQIVVVDSTLKLITGKSLNGIGTVRGNVTSDSGSSVNVGLGILNITNVATLNGALNMQLNRTNAINASKLTAGSLVNASALTITNVGPALEGGDTFALFNGAVTGFTATNLPALVSPMYWTNNLAVNGTIAVVNPIATYSTNITAVVNGGSLEISWPATHIGWMIEVQTNSLAVGLSSNWVTISNTAALLGYTNTFNPANGSVFYRLRKP